MKEFKDESGRTVDIKQALFAKINSRIMLLRDRWERLEQYWDQPVTEISIANEIMSDDFFEKALKEILAQIPRTVLPTQGTSVEMNAVRPAEETLDQMLEARGCIRQKDKDEVKALKFAYYAEEIKKAAAVSDSVALGAAKFFAEAKPLALYDWEGSVRNSFLDKGKELSLRHSILDEINQRTKKTLGFGGIAVEKLSPILDFFDLLPSQQRHYIKRYGQRFEAKKFAERQSTRVGKANAYDYYLWFRPAVIPEIAIILDPIIKKIKLRNDPSNINDLIIISYLKDPENFITLMQPLTAYGIDASTIENMHNALQQVCAKLPSHVQIANIATIFNVDLTPQLAVQRAIDKIEKMMREKKISSLETNIEKLNTAVHKLQQNLEIQRSLLRKDDLNDLQSALMADITNDPNGFYWDRVNRERLLVPLKNGDVTHTSQVIRGLVFTIAVAFYDSDEVELQKAINELTSRFTTGVDEIKQHIKQLCDSCKDNKYGNFYGRRDRSIEAIAIYETNIADLTQQSRTLQAEYDSIQASRAQPATEPPVRRPPVHRQTRVRFSLGDGNNDQRDPRDLPNPGRTRPEQ